MMLDGSCGHRPMIQRPSDMVSVVDRWLIVVLCVKKYGTFVRTLTKKGVFAQLIFFNSSLSDEEVSFVKKYLCVICRA